MRYVAASPEISADVPAAADAAPASREAGDEPSLVPKPRPADGGAMSFSAFCAALVHSASAILHGREAPPEQPAFLSERLRSLMQVVVSTASRTAAGEAGKPVAGPGRGRGSAGKTPAGRGAPRGGRATARGRGRG